MNKNLIGTKMKKIMSIFLVCAALICAPVFAQGWQCDYLLPQCPDKVQQYDAALHKVIDQQELNKISNVEMAQKILQITKEMYPKDQTLISLSEQRLATYQLLADLKASPEAVEKMRKANTDFYLKVLSDRFEMANAFIDADREYQRQQQSRSSAGNTAAVATMLNGIGRAFNNSFGQSITPPPRICNYYGGTSYCF